MNAAFLTIDDGPSASTGALSDFLAERGIQALMFMRGDFLEKHPAEAVYAVKKGMVLGNHLYSHRRAGTLDFETLRDEILQTEDLINAAYSAAGRTRPGKYLRFPYIDRGDGDPIERRFPVLLSAVAEGVFPALRESSSVRRLQDFLKAEGFIQPFGNPGHPLYKITQIRDAADCLFTYSTCDWMLTDRHLNKRIEGELPYKSIKDLTDLMDRDPFLWNAQHGPAIILIHDAPDIHECSTALVQHMNAKGLNFNGF